MAEDKKRYGDLESFDPSKREAKGVSESIEAADLPEDVVIRDEKIKEKAARREQEAREREAAEAEKVTVDEALLEDKVLQSASARTNVRVLVLTRDVAALVDGSVTEARLLEYGKMFAEVHVVVFCMKGQSANEPSRIAKNVWVYPTNSSHWWKMFYDGYRTAKEQLVFGKGFRADLIIAEDPFESGIVAWYLARKYERTFQVHVFENYFDAEFQKRDPHSGLRLMASAFVLPRATCIRTDTAFLREAISNEHPELESVTEVLPTYFNFDAWQQGEIVHDLHNEYPEFKFLVLHFSSMTGRSHTDAVIDGLYYLLKQYPILGLVVVGDGPLRATYQKRVEAYELTKKVRFIEADDEYVSYIKSANVVIHTSQDSEDDKFLLCAAATGTPLIAADHGLAEMLFEDGESAFLCPIDSPPCIGEKLNRFLSENQLRTRFELAARTAVTNRIEQDYGAYIQSYRNSIERCIVGES